MSLVCDDELAKLLPVRVAVVDIALSDGRNLSERVAAVRGTPRNPMSRAEVIAKARDLVESILGSEKTRRFIEAVYAIESTPNLRTLRPFLQGL